MTNEIFKEEQLDIMNIKKLCLTAKTLCFDMGKEFY